MSCWDEAIFLPGDEQFYHRGVYKNSIKKILISQIQQAADEQKRNVIVSAAITLNGRKSADKSNASPNAFRGQRVVLDRNYFEC